MRINYRKQFPAGAQAIAGLEQAVRGAALEPGLLELVRIRASQISGCAYCLAMHNRDARAHGEHATRLDTVAAWREAPFFTVRERAGGISNVGSPACAACGTGSPEVTVTRRRDSYPDLREH